MSNRFIQLWLLLFGLVASTQANWAQEHHDFGDFPLRLVAVAAVVTGLLWGVNHLETHMLRRLTGTSRGILTRALPISAMTPLALLPLTLLFPLDFVRILIFATSSIMALLLVSLTPSEQFSLQFQRYVALATSIIVAAAGATQVTMLFTLIVQLSSLAVLFVVPGFMALRLTLRNRCSTDQALLIAFPVTLLLFGAIWLLSQYFKAPAIIYALADTALIIGMAYFYGPARLVSDCREISSQYRFGILLVVFAALISMSFLMSGSKTPWMPIENGQTAAYRGLHELPTDNQLQYDTAVTFNLYSKPWRWMPRTEQIWTMGDRPPLMAMVNSIVAFFTFSNNSWSYHTYQVIGTLLNTLFLFPLVPLLLRLFGSRRIAFLASLAVFINIFIFLNTYYTWPKLLGVFFVLASIEFAFANKKHLLVASAGGILWGFGALSHGGVLLSLPLPMFAWLVSLMTKGTQSKPSALPGAAHAATPRVVVVLRCLIAFLIVFALMQTPWSLYKKSHPDIDSNNLIYHYLPIEDPDHIGHTRQNHLKELKLFLGSTSLAVQISHRINNMEIFGFSEFRYAIQGWLTGNFECDLNNLYTHKFFYPISAVGEFQIFLALIAIILAVSGALMRVSSVSVSIGPNWRLIALCATCIAASYLLNVFAKWTASSNHVLPYGELVISAGIIYGIALLLPHPFNLILTFVALVQFVHYVATSTVAKGLVFTSFFNCIVFLVLALLYWYAFRSSCEEESPRKVQREGDVDRLTDAPFLRERVL